MAVARFLVTPGSAAIALQGMLRISEHAISVSAGVVALACVETKEKGLQTSRLQALYDWCPGEDSNLHASQR
jgi:hypothetical protein